MSPSTPPPGLASGARLRVMAGTPSREQLAAAILAIDQAAAADNLIKAVSARSAWLRAARAEGVGGGPIASPAQLPVRR